MSTTLLWAIFGVLAILSELMMGSFFLLFLGISSLIVAGARLAGLDHFMFEALLFATLSLASILLFRKKLVAGLHSKGKFTIDNKVMLEHDLPPHGMASISYQGSLWSAENTSDEILKAGEFATIVRIEGIKLFLKSQHK